MLRFLVGDADFYRKTTGGKTTDSFQELSQNFADVNLQVPMYFQLQKQSYNSAAIEDTHRWLKKKFDRYGDKGGSDKGNGLQYLYGAICKMADVDLDDVRVEDTLYYDLWYNLSTFSKSESTKLRVAHMNHLYGFYFE